MSLHICRDLPKVKALLASKADPNAYDNDGNTPLIYCKDIKILTALVEGKADVNKQCKDGSTPLFVSYVRSIEYLSLLLSYKADPNIVNNEGCNAIHNFAHYTNPIPQHIQLVIDHGGDIHHHDNRGYTPLHTCTNPDNMKVLLDNKADSNDSNNVGKASPLMILMMSNHVPNPYPLVSLLLEYNADINHCDVVGRTPLYFSNDVKTTQLLIDNKADIHHIDNDGYNILSSQYIKSHDIARVLIKNNADAKYINRENGYTTIMESIIQSKSIEYIKVLIDNKADLHHISPIDGFSLWNTAHRMPLGCMRFLLQSKLDPNLRNGRGLHSLYCVDTIEKAGLLLQYKADVNIISSDNSTTLLIQVNFPIDIKRLLIEHKANVNHILNGGYPTLSRSPTYETTKLLIDSKADLTWIDPKTNISMLWMTLLMQSTWTPNNYLLSVQPCKNDPKYPDGHCKVYGGYLNIIEKILKAKVDPNLRDTDGRVPYQLTVDPDIRKLLVKYKAIPVDDAVIRNPSGTIITKDNINDPIDDDNNTCISTQQAIYSMSRLIYMNANINARNKYDYTPLMVTRDYAYARNLVMYKADIHHRSTYDGTTVLHHASNEDIYDLLINAKADPNIADFKGNKPIRGLPIVKSTFPELDKKDDGDGIDKDEDTRNDKNQDDHDSNRHHESNNNSNDNQVNNNDDNHVHNSSNDNQYTQDDNDNDSIIDIKASGVPAEPDTKNTHDSTNTPIKKIDPYSIDRHGYTPLHNAQSGDEVRLLVENKITQLLLDANADPTISNNKGPQL